MHRRHHHDSLSILNLPLLNNDMSIDMCTSSFPVLIVHNLYRQCKISQSLTALFDRCTRVRM